MMAQQNGLKILALGFGTQLHLLQGRQRDAVYQHQVSELILVTFEKSLSMGIKITEKEFILYTCLGQIYYCQIKQG